MAPTTRLPHDGDHSFRFRRIADGSRQLDGGTVFSVEWTGPDGPSDYIRYVAGEGRTLHRIPITVN